MYANGFAAWLSTKNNRQQLACCIEAIGGRYIKYKEEKYYGNGSTTQSCGNEF